MSPARARRRRRGVALVVTLLLLVAAAVVLVRWQSAPPTAVGCSTHGDGTDYQLDLAQTANAATIASVGVREGLGDHAVTVALATALQESKLHNLSYGDRDSVGLFQQRPSQGWGPRQQLLDPHFAASAFYTHLGQVPGWRTLPVADAAQAVQRSASGAAYASWEAEARTLARALTGEVPHGLTCSFVRPLGSSVGLSVAVGRDLGPAAVGSVVPLQSGWRSATWLVAQAAQYDIDRVSFAGMQWTRTSGAWQLQHGSGPVVHYALGRRGGA